MKFKKINLNISKPVWQVVSLGVLAGMRANSAPAIASHILSRHHSKNLSRSPLRFMQSNKVALSLKVLAAAEFVGDKLPKTPNRIESGGLIFRCLTGSLAGAGIYKASGGYALTGALLGGIAAAGATFGSYYLRKNAVKCSNIIDPVIGTIEDALVIGAGIGLVRTA